MPPSSDPYHLLLGIAPESQPANHYQLLGIERLEFNIDVIHNAAERQLDHLGRHAKGEFGASLSAIESSIIQARDCLSNQDEHRRYAAELQGFDLASSEPTAIADLRSFDHEFDRTWQAAQQIEFDPQHHWLGIPPHQRPASNERMLGLSIGERNPIVMQNSAERQIAFVKKFAGGNHADQANELLRNLGRVLASMKRDRSIFVSPQIQQSASVPENPKTRHDGPESIKPPLYNSRSNFVDQEVAIGEQGAQLLPALISSSDKALSEAVPLKRTRPRQKRQSRMSVMIPAMMWVIPFVLPGAAILGYVKWSSGDGDRIAGALDVLLGRSDRPNVQQETSAGSPDRAKPELRDLTVPRRIPRQMHASPKSLEQERPSEPPNESGLNHITRPSFESDGDQADRSAEPPTGSSIQNGSKPTPQTDQPPREPFLFDAPRKWHSKTGQSFDANVVVLSYDQVTMKSAENGRAKSFPMEFFVAEDEKLLRLASFDHDDNQQFQLAHELATFVPRLSEDQSNKLTNAHNTFINSPYAGLWSSVAISQNKSQFASAKNSLKAVVGRIERQREIGPDRHAMTLSSALNNVAICLIMDHQASAAAGYLVRSVEAMPSPSPIVLHNARFLLKIGTEAGSPFNLNSVTERNLAQALADQPTNESGLRERWYYALDVDLPRSTDSQRNEFRYLSQQLGPDSVRSILAVRHELCVSCKAIGVHPCRNCNKGIVAVKREVQYGVNEITKKPQFRTEVFRERCGACNGRGNFDCKFCDAGRLK